MSAFYRLEEREREREGRRKRGRRENEKDTHGERREREGKYGTTASRSPDSFQPIGIAARLEVAKGSLSWRYFIIAFFTKRLMCVCGEEGGCTPSALP